MGPINISETPPNYFDLTVYLNEGGLITIGPVSVDRYIIFESNSLGGSVDSLSVHLIIADSVQFPEYAEIRTENIRINFNNAGNIGHGGNPPDGGWNMNFFEDCDTTGNIVGNDDNISVYLREASPFICYIDGSDTILNYAMCNADWTSPDGFIPLKSPSVDSITFPDYQYGYSGRFVTHDSNISVSIEYFAPKTADSSDFIVTRYKIYNNTDSDFTNIFMGEIIDWDIPSDSGVENYSDFEATRKLMYCYGAECGPDEVANNDCVLAEQRLGGMAYYGGYKYFLLSSDDIFETPLAMWTHINADWIEPTGGFKPGDFYKWAANQTGYKPWESTNPYLPDSLYQDLHMVSVYTQVDLIANDTLYFVKILATENINGIGGLLATVDKAQAWISHRPNLYDPYYHPSGRCCWGEDNNISCYDMPFCGCAAVGGQWDLSKNCEDNPCPCCLTPGDCSDDGAINILDVTCIINWLYREGLTPLCQAESDVNGNEAVNILDVTSMINYIYKGGPAPICPPEN